MPFKAVFLSMEIILEYSFSSSLNIEFPATNTLAPASTHNFDVSLLMPPSTSKSIFNFELSIKDLIFDIYLAVYQ